MIAGRHSLNYPLSFLSRYLERLVKSCLFTSEKELLEFIRIRKYLINMYDQTSNNQWIWSTLGERKDDNRKEDIPRFSLPDFSAIFPRKPNGVGGGRLCDNNPSIMVRGTYRVAKLSGQKLSRIFETCSNILSWNVMLEIITIATGEIRFLCSKYIGVWGP